MATQLSARFSMGKIISQLNSSDFNNQSNILLLDELISKFQSNDSRANKNINLFCDNGGVELISRWVAKSPNFNLTQTPSEIIKLYYGRIASILAIGSGFQPFCGKLVRKNVIEKILVTFMVGSIFGDTNFTTDVFSATLISVLNCVKIDAFHPYIQAALKYAFGPGLILIQHRFRAESRPHLKILLASLLTQQENLTELHTEQLALDFNIYLNLRDVVLITLGRFVYSDISSFTYPMQTSFVIPLMYSSTDLARHFNSLLLAERNRENSCGGSTLQYHLSSNDYYSKTLELSIYSLRVLQFLSQTCENYALQLQGKGIEDRKYTVIEPLLRKNQVVKI